MKMTPRTLRTTLIVLTVVTVLVIGYAAVRLLLGPASTTDTKGCVWDEISPLQMKDYQNASDKGYQIKSEDGKYYLLRECKQEEMR